MVSSGRFQGFLTRSSSRFCFRTTRSPPGNSATRPPRSPRKSFSTPMMCTSSNRRRSPLPAEIHWRNARRRTAAGAFASTLTLSDGTFVSALLSGTATLASSKSCSASRFSTARSSRNSSAVRVKASTILPLNEAIKGISCLRTRTRANRSSSFIGSER